MGKFILLMLICCSANAAMYSCVDENGTRILRNYPCDKGEKQQVIEREVTPSHTIINSTGERQSYRSREPEIYIQTSPLGTSAVSASYEDTEDLARVESLRAQCNAAGAAAARSTSAMGKFAAAQLGIGYCSKYERAAKDRRRYEALRSQDPVAAAKELEAQRLAREERRRDAAINAQRQAKGAVVGGSQDITNSNGCSSDFSCGIGFRCVKRAFETSGVCMREVDSMGLPTYGTPRSSSIDVKTKNQCMFSTDCPIGFACDPTYGACVKQ